MLQKLLRDAFTSPGPVPKRWATVAERILVIEDGSAVRRALKRLLELEGYTVDLAADGISGLELLRRTIPSAVLLDLSLPDISGEEICRKIAQIVPRLPIIVVSANSQEEEKVVLLEMGACDYVTKPFSPRELLARVRVALRRSAQINVEDVFAFDDVTVNFSRMELTRGGQPISLTRREFRILKLMLQNPERPIPREELLREVWGYQNPGTRTVDTHMLKLRQKLERDPSKPVHFKTVHSFGYKFVP